MAVPAIALFPTLLASIVMNDTNPNYTFFADDHGISFLIDISEPAYYTLFELTKIEQSARETSFFLYTQNNRKIGQQLFIDDIESVKNSFWNPHRSTYIVTHGWRGDTDPGSSCTLIRDAYLSTGDYNVILADWRTAAGNLLYWKVVKSVPLVAEHLTRFINFLVKNAGLDTKRTRLTGHSLGGHIVGLAARAIDSNIAEVMALDPAKPMYNSKGPGERVDKTDADFVQVIHTSSIGITKPIGDADFYPNGGNKQPGCSVIVPGCAHSRAYEYYAESIMNPTGFRAGEVFMGGPKLDSKAQGSYTLQTRESSPFALG
ncbi:lipase member H-like [Nylanderia fulva]|uniref:lipase member H-like n=1 Tax=Nylanderia fulva TaxID=613905 RepID=UPI0010FBAAF5|nr:lipase member H-like [Nylanderia fulva]